MLAYSEEYKVWHVKDKFNSYSQSPLMQSWDDYLANKDVLDSLYIMSGLNFMNHPSYEYSRYFNSPTFTVFDNGLFLQSIKRYGSGVIPEFVEPKEVFSECASSAFEIKNPPPMLGYDPRCRAWY